MSRKIQGGDRESRQKVMQRSCNLQWSLSARAGSLSVWRGHGYNPSGKTCRSVARGVGDPYAAVPNRSIPLPGTGSGRARNSDSNPILLLYCMNTGMGITSLPRSGSAPSDAGTAGCKRSLPFSWLSCEVKYLGWGKIASVPIFLMRGCPQTTRSLNQTSHPAIPLREERMTKKKGSPSFNSFRRRARSGLSGGRRPGISQELASPRRPHHSSGSTSVPVSHGKRQSLW